MYPTVFGCRVNIETAFTFLNSGKSHLENESCFWVNLGCYHCQLGRLKEAGECVRKSIDLDKSYKAMALDDEDLEPLWERFTVERP